MSIPPLAGLATYERAAQPSYIVEKNVKLFLRYSWIEKRLMETGLYRLASTSEWEVKEALDLPLRSDADNAGAICMRVGEMRNPVPRMDVSLDPAIDRLFGEFLMATDTPEKIVGLYGVIRPTLLAAYETHYAEINPTFDHPNWRMIKHILVDQNDIMAWGDATVEAVVVTPEDEARAKAWRRHLGPAQGNKCTP